MGMVCVHGRGRSALRKQVSDDSLLLFFPLLLNWCVRGRRVASFLWPWPSTMRLVCLTAGCLHLFPSSV